MIFFFKKAGKERKRNVNQEGRKDKQKAFKSKYVSKYIKKDEILSPKILAKVLSLVISGWDQCQDSREKANWKDLSEGSHNLYVSKSDGA